MKKEWNGDYFIKYVPGLTDSGYLDPRAKQEIEKGNEAAQMENTAEPSLQDMRDAMGWPAARDISKHPLTITERQTDRGVTVRIYERADLSGNVPVLLFFHGGGFFGGSLDNVENPCRLLADLDELKVISVDYSLAPERPFPNGLLDCYTSIVWAVSHAGELGIDPDNLSVAGDSAGGSLSFAVSLLDRTLGTYYIKNQVLIYPATISRGEERFWDLSNLKMKADQELITDYIHGFEASTDLVDKMYAENILPENPFISAAKTPLDQLAKMPRTLLAIGEFDPLRVQGEILFQHLQAADVDVTYLRYNGMIHAFMDKVGDYVQAADLLDETVKFILK
ncbi:alpha/beta hydrolase [Listeria costaricensis]|uniref:alpha/beta hydrolase n=1 Tax=Listeria costaricensis TaxID=2026604 RepID=UPI0013C40F8D|nr:alpha/beta hydrolase [Listeria costaricensis]